MNEWDMEVNICVIDSLLNYEMVKYFINEDYEVECFDCVLMCYEDVVVKL